MTEYNVGSITAKMKAEASGWSSTIEKMIRDADKLEARFTALGGIGAALAAGAAMFVGAGIKQNATIERLSVSYRVLLKDADAANEAMAYVRKLADTSPYQMEETLDAGRAMLAYGLDLKTYMTDAMNLAAAMGVQLNDVVRALGRIKSGDFGEAFERLRDFGISRDLLEGKGLVFDRGGSYQGSVDQALTAIQAIIRERFGGMIEEQAQTWNGLISTITDKIQSLTADATSDLFAGLKGPLTEFKDWLEGLDATSAKVLGGIIQLLGALGLLVATSTAIVLWGAKVSAALSGIGLAAKIFLANPIFLVIAAITTLVITIGTIKRASDEARRALIENAKAAQTDAKSHGELVDAYKETKKQLDGAKKGTEEYNKLEEQLHTQMEEIGKIYPGVVTAYNEMNRVRGISIELLEKELKKERDLASHRKAQAQSELSRQIKAVQKEIDQMEQSMKDDLEVWAWESREGGVPALYQKDWEKRQKALDDARDTLKELNAQYDALTVVRPSYEPKGEGGDEKDKIDSNTAARQAAAIREIRDNVLEALNEAEKREIADLNDRYAEYEKLELKTVEIDGKIYTLKEAQEIELAAIRKKYSDERELEAQRAEEAIAAIETGLQRDLIQLTQSGTQQQLALLDMQQAEEIKQAEATIKNAERLKQVKDDIDKKYRLIRENLLKEQSAKEQEIIAGLQTELLKLQEDSQAKELALLAEEEADERQRIAKSIENEDTKNAAITALEEIYAQRRLAIITKYARLAAETKHDIELTVLEYEHQYRLISDEEYYAQRIKLAKDNAERMKAEHGAESVEYKEALAEITQTEYESIIAREQLEKELTEATLKEIEIRLTAQVLSGELSKEQADATMAALALIYEKLRGITEDEAEKAKQNLQTIQSTIQGGLATILKDFAHGEKSIAEIWESMLNRMLDSFIDFIAQLTAKKLATWLINLIPGLSMEGGGIVPNMAVASAAGGMMTGSFSGGIPAILHEKEMVLPKNISQFILDTMAQAGGGAQGPQAIIQISAVDGPSVQRMLYEQRDMITGILNQAWKRNSPIRRGG